MSEAKPYNYCIGWTKLNKWYYGLRSRNVQLGIPAKDDLWVNYFSSSVHVREFRRMHGDPDHIEIIEEFETVKEALRRETKFLKEVAAKEPERWLNHNFGETYFPYTRRPIIQEIIDEVRAKMDRKSRRRWKKAKTDLEPIEPAPQLLDDNIPRQNHTKTSKIPQHLRGFLSGSFKTQGLRRKEILDYLRRTDCQPITTRFQQELPVSRIQDFHRNQLLSILLSRRY